MRINEQALADAIRDSGVSPWQLAGRVGVDVGQLVHAKDLGRLPLGVLLRLAETVDLPLSRLFGSDVDDVAEVPPDVTLVGACLATQTQGLTGTRSGERLAGTFTGWSPPFGISRRHCRPSDSG